MSNWKQKLTHYSTVALTTIVGASAWYLSHPELQAVLPPKVTGAAVFVVGVAGLIGKFIPQGKSNEPS